jgi:regulator of nucleoside diphosphate kinase
MMARTVTEQNRGRLRRLIEKRQESEQTAGDSDALSHMLAQSEIVDAAEIPCTVVTINSEIVILERHTGDVFTFSVVLPRAASAAKNKLSVLSDFGLSLLGREVGDEYSFEAPAGSRRIRIEKIAYQPEAFGLCA